jgi:hypothetical protein
LISHCYWVPPSTARCEQSVLALVDTGTSNQLIVTIYDDVTNNGGTELVSVTCPNPLKIMTIVSYGCEVYGPGPNFNFGGPCTIALTGTGLSHIISLTTAVGTPSEVKVKAVLQCTT